MVSLIVFPSICASINSNYARLDITDQLLNRYYRPKPLTAGQTHKRTDTRVDEHKRNDCFRFLVLISFRSLMSTGWMQTQTHGRIISLANCATHSFAVDRAQFQFHPSTADLCASINRPSSVIVALSVSDCRRFSRAAAAAGAAAGAERDPAIRDKDRWLGHGASTCTGHAWLGPTGQQQQQQQQQHRGRRSGHSYIIGQWPGSD